MMTPETFPMDIGMINCPNCQTLNNQNGEPNLHIFNCLSCNHLVIFDDKKGIVSTNNWFIKKGYVILKSIVDCCSTGIMMIVEIPRRS